MLGVLYNVTQDYDSAAESFRAALAQNETDYTLWNKLGATLANGGKCQEALPAYRKAIELRPKYARGWLNVGVSHSNMNQYEEAAASYLKVGRSFLPSLIPANMTIFRP